MRWYKPFAWTSKTVWQTPFLSLLPSLNYFIIVTEDTLVHRSKSEGFSFPRVSNCYHPPIIIYICWLCHNLIYINEEIIQLMDTVTFWYPYRLCINIAIPSKVCLLLWRKTLKFYHSSCLEYTVHCCIPVTLLGHSSMPEHLAVHSHLAHCASYPSPHSSTFCVSLWAQQLLAIDCTTTLTRIIFPPFKTGLDYIVLAGLKLIM